MRRYPYIDVARGIGMVLVVAGHAMGISMYLTCFFLQLFFIIIPVSIFSQTDNLYRKISLKYLYTL